MCNKNIIIQMYFFFLGKEKPHEVFLGSCSLIELIGSEIKLKEKQ